MQKFTKLNANGYLYNEIPKLYDDMATALSNSSGNAFPTDNLQVGMTCYRTDQRATYLLTKLEGNNATWELQTKLDVTPGTAEFDGNGNKISEHYLTVHGGTVDQPIKYSGSDLSDTSTLVPKSYVDETVQQAANQVTGKIDANNEALKKSVSDVQTSGVSKLATVRKINKVAFDGTKDIDIPPDNITMPSGSTAKSTVPTLDTVPSITTSSIAKSNNKQYAVFNPQSLKIKQTITTTRPGTDVFKGKSLRQAVEILIANYHTHGSKTQDITASFNCYGQCNCNCDCNCDCGDDGGS